ncbi:MAG: enoyl-CoA hydratase/isomerase family protein [Sulfuricaulis sp.]|nr:enoyl-CoA hydratase/isomerase family protein [Sulfuricaulis sp.]
MSALQKPTGNAGDAVLYSLSDKGVVTISLNQPDTRNAINDELLAGLMAALDRAEHESAARCVVLTSTHDKVFSAGGDLKGMAATETVVTKHIRNGSMPDLVHAIVSMKVPVLCALNGHALAGGFGLVMACDLVIAKQGVRIGTPEINVGVFPFMISALMQRNIPRKRMSEMIFLGDQMSAEEAQSLGFINRVVAPSEFAETVRDWSERLASKSPLLLKLGKKALFEQQDLALMPALGLLQHYLTLAQSTADVKEGVAAFLEKRAPVWSGA